MLVGLWFSARCDLASAVAGWIWAENFIPKAMGRCPRALCNDPSAHPGGSVQSATGHPHIRASPCSVQRPSRAHGRVCAECCEASGHSGGVVQRAATRSDVRAGRCRVQRGIPSREMGRCSAHWGIRSRAMRWFSVIYSSVTRASLSQKTRSGRWRIPACLVASKRGSRKRRKTEPKGFLRIFPSAFSDLFVS